VRPQRSRIAADGTLPLSGNGLDAIHDAWFVAAQTEE
jgi:hypothetical protein